MKVAYLDCASGISGDMTLAALVDAGVPLAEIQTAIDSLGLPTCRFEVEEVKRKGFRGLKLHVRHTPEHAHRHLSDILRMIEASILTARQRKLATQMFTALGEAEALAHGTTIEKVHFHEVGAVDSIADLVGSAVAFDLLGVQRVYSSPIPTGSGTIKIAHGLTSVPAPATAELLKGIPLADSPVEAELTTPTGATIVRTMVSEYRRLPPMTIEAIGYGAGSMDFEARANLLRILIGTLPSAPAEPLEVDQVVVIEANLDDTTGEVVAHAAERLREAGALEVYTTPIQMKKNRPAVKLTALAPAEAVADVEQTLFLETTTIGTRRWTADRSKLSRSESELETPWGPVRAKQTVLPDGTIRLKPEYEACAELARGAGVPLQRILDHLRASRGS
ncbi:MAG: nickel pincer cofactor biosynthesis protein LarC [Planctomycetota bacterium]